LRELSKGRREDEEGKDEEEEEDEEGEGGGEVLLADPRQREISCCMSVGSKCEWCVCAGAGPARKSHMVAHCAASCEASGCCIQKKYLRLVSKMWRK
jgi:hypothetical protein